MAEDTQTTLNDDEIKTSWSDDATSAPSEGQPIKMSSDADASDGSDADGTDADGSDGDATDSADGDASDSADADGQDA